VSDLLVSRDRGVVLFGHDPLVDAGDSSRLEDLEDLRVDALKGRGVDGGLDGVD
jgi:hypothetical protein